MNSEFSPESQLGEYQGDSRNLKRGAASAVPRFGFFSATAPSTTVLLLRLELHLHLLLLFLCHGLPPPVAARGRILHPRGGSLLRQELFPQAHL